MNYFMSFDDFYVVISREFAFLIREGYSEKTFEKGRTYRLFYSNSEIIVCVEYGLTNNYLGVYFSREEIKDTSNQSRLNNMLDLSYYLTANGYGREFYQNLMPDVIGFESSVKEISLLVKSNAIDIIRGMKWVTNQMIIKNGMV